jgi:hypothetical protein
MNECHERGGCTRKAWWASLTSPVLALVGVAPT